MNIHVHLSIAPIPSSSSSRSPPTYTSARPTSSSHSHSPPPNPPISAPTPPVILTTSAYNASFIYPTSLCTGSSSSTSRPRDPKKSYISAASGQLNKPSDIWKVFNPALCRNEEMPRLLVLRDCVSKEGGRGISGAERDLPSYSLKTGTFDIGAIDYRGQCVSLSLRGVYLSYLGLYP